MLCLHYLSCYNIVKEEEQLVSMHFMTRAVDLGSDLANVSAKHWNAHEEYPQFGGPAFIVKQGIGTVLTKMAAGFTVEYNKQVNSHFLIFLSDYSFLC